jgi:hypothetical protein
LTTYPQVGTGGSTSSSNALYGRQWLLQVSAPSQQSGSDTVLTVSSSGFAPEALRIVFNCYTPVFQRYWTADIDIYNFDPEFAQTLISTASNITPGMQVLLKAGYQNGQYDTIFSGPVFQPTFVRENVTDYKLTLHCILDLAAAVSGRVMSAVYAGFNQSQVVNAMIGALGLQSGHISSGISSKTLWRDKVVLGSAADTLDEIAKDNSMVWLLSRGLGGSANTIDFGSLSDTATTPGYVYSPTSGLLGTPIQTQNGVDFSVLLDARVKAQIPLLTVGIEQAIIQQFVLPQPGSGQLAYPLDSTGTYVAGAVRHRGDSRGDMWQTDITGFVKKSDILNQLVAASA